MQGKINDLKATIENLKNSPKNLNVVETINKVNDESENKKGSYLNINLNINNNQPEEIESDSCLIHRYYEL